LLKDENNEKYVAKNESYLESLFVIFQTEKSYLETFFVIIKTENTLAKKESVATRGDEAGGSGHGPDSALSARNIARSEATRSERSERS
jgi:hypothetical protein